VLEEALRVLQFREICLDLVEAGPGVQDQGRLREALEQLGQLMDKSQESCAELFACSCPEIDSLTRLAREAGSFGSRLTGNSPLKSCEDAGA